MRSVLGVHWRDWYWSWNSNTLATWCEELTHLKRPWCWERLRAGGEGYNKGWDGWIASPTQWTWVGWTPGVGDGQGGLACCCSWGRKELDMTERLNGTELWTVLSFKTYHRPKAEPGFLCLSQIPIELSHCVIDGKCGTNCMSPSSSHERPPSGRSASERSQGPGCSCQDPVHDCGPSEQLHPPIRSSSFQVACLLVSFFFFSFFKILLFYHQCPDTNIISIFPPERWVMFPLFSCIELRKPGWWSHPRQLIIYNWGK